MDWYDVKFTGKVKSLVEEFEKAEVSCDISSYEIDSKIAQLIVNKWDIYLTKLPSRIGFYALRGKNVEEIHDEDIDFIGELISEKLERMPEPNLSEDEKIDRIVEFFQDGWFEMDLEMLETVAVKVKAQNITEYTNDKI